MREMILTDVVRLLRAQQLASLRYPSEARAALTVSPDAERLAALREHCRVVADRFERAVASIDPARLDEAIAYEFVDGGERGAQRFEDAAVLARTVERLAGEASQGDSGDVVLAIGELEAALA